MKNVSRYIDLTFCLVVLPVMALIFPIERWCHNFTVFITNDKKALVSLERFITMMRYVHQSSQKDLVSLAEEIYYIRQYTALQSLRLNDMTTVSMDINVTSEELMLPPMLLITFVENCFKHGVSSIEKSKIRITLHENNGVIVFTTANHIFPAQHIGEHMGIELQTSPGSVVS